MIDARTKRRIVGTADSLAITTLLGIIAVAVGFRIRYDNWLADYDRLSQFLPWFDYVGNAIREFRVPAWNPADASGAPIAGSPATSWMFLPAMLVFPLFETILAYKLMVLLHALIAGLPLYAFCRRIGLGPIGALASSATFAVGPMLYAATMYQTGSGHVLMYIPLGMLAAESAIRAPLWSSRLGWSAVAGLALANMYTGSPPRVAYGAACIAGWMAYRWLIAPHPDGGDPRQHLIRVLTSGLAMAAFAITFVAAALLPQLEFIAASNVPGGDYSNLIGGDYAESTSSLLVAAQNLLQGEVLYQRPVLQGLPVLFLALLGLFLGGRKYGVPYFAATLFIGVELTTNVSILREIGYLIPAIEHFDEHKPTAVAMFISFPLSMLIGAGIHVVSSRMTRRNLNLLHLVPLVAVLIVAIWMNEEGYPAGWRQIWLVMAAALLVLLILLPVPTAMTALGRAIPRASALALIFIALAFPTGADLLKTARDSTAAPEWDNIIARDPGIQNSVKRILSEEDPGTAAEFLQERQAFQQPFRYAPFTGSAVTGGWSSALHRQLETPIVAILANGRATRLGLEQIPGYNVVHYLEYVDYYDVMNGGPQNYHWLDAMTPAISGSPLLDMLNVRYVLIPVSLGYIPPFAYIGTEVYRDAEVIVYENPNVFPRAWIVHGVQPAQDGAELQLLNTGQVDGRATAFVHGDPPPVSQPDPNGPADSVVVTSYEPETIELSARSTGDGLLVLSEVYANGWNAYVDGERVDVLRTNHALRGVPLSAGEHEVVLRYEPLPLRIGLWSTGLSSVAMIGVWIWAGVDWRRRRRLPNANPQAS